MAAAVLERESLIPYLTFMIVIATNKIINKPPQSNHTMFTLLQLSKHCPCMKWGHKITSHMTLFLGLEGKVTIAVFSQIQIESEELRTASEDSSTGDNVAQRGSFRNTATEQPLGYFLSELRHLIRGDMA